MASREIPMMTSGGMLSNEFRLMAACSWLAPETLQSEKKTRICELASSCIDWDIFNKLLQRHGVAALSYTVLKKHAAEIVPESCLKELQQLNNHSRRRALVQTAELVALLGLFSRQGIEVAPLKGVYLSYQLYGDIGVRNSVDIDILVRAEQVEAAEQLLTNKGYLLDVCGASLTPTQKRYLRTHIHHYHFSNPKTGLHIELHWSLGLWSDTQTALLWNHSAEKAVWHGVPITTFSRELLLLILCDHGAKHEWSNLKWLSDVVQLISTQSTLQWSTVLMLADQLDLKRVLAHSVVLVNRVYGIPIPDELHDLVTGDRLAVTLSERAITALLMSASEIAVAGKNARGLRLAWQTKQLKPSMSFFTALKPCVVSPCDWEIIQLPPSLFWLYYPLRPLLWFFRHFVKRTQ
jgi:hypothetical protein